MRTQNTLWIELEERFGLRPTTISGLLDESSDWARVVKVHAVIEAALNVRLISRFPELRRIVTELPLDDGRYGKLKLLNEVRWISESELRFVRAIKDLRNKLVHDVTYLDFSLDEDTKRWPSSRAAFDETIYDFWNTSTKGPEEEATGDWEPGHIQFLLFSATFRFLYDSDELVRAHSRQTQPPA